MSNTNGKTSQGIGPGGNEGQGGSHGWGNPGQGGGNDPQTGPMVEISVDGKAVEIHRGSQTIADIKNVGGVPLADQLQLEKPEGGLEKLDQNGRFTIKGGEKFVSFRATGAAS